MGMGWVLAHIQPGPHFSEQRKMLRRGIGPQRVGSHDEIIEKHATRLMVALNNFEGSPHELIQRSVFTFWLRRTAFTDMVIHKFPRTLGRGIVEIAYGEKILNLI